MPNGLTVYAASNDIECADIYSDQPTNLTVKKKKNCICMPGLSDNIHQRKLLKQA